MSEVNVMRIICRQLFIALENVQKCYQSFMLYTIFTVEKAAELLRREQGVSIYLLVSFPVIIYDTPAASLYLYTLVKRHGLFEYGVAR